MDYPFTLVFPMVGNAPGTEIELTAHIERGADGQWYVDEIADEDGNLLAEIGPVATPLFEAILATLYSKAHIAAIDLAWDDHCVEEREAAAEANAEFSAGAHW